MKLTEHPIVILGMQRSGTSAVAGALAKLGAFLGESQDFYSPDTNNEAGYFEQRALTTFNHKCLAFFQMHAASVRPLPPSWSDYPQAKILADELRTYLSNSFEGHFCWGFKQPMASILIDLYLSVFADLGLRPQFVVCVRNPLEIKASEANWQYSKGGRQMPPLGSAAIGSWLRYTLGALGAIRDHPFTVVPYAKFVETPKNYLSEIVEKHGRLTPDEQQWTEALASIQPKLQHQSAVQDDLRSYPDLVKQALDYCLKGVHNSDRLAELVDEFERWLEILEPPRLSGTKIGLAWTQGGEMRSVTQPFLPLGEWQNLSFAIEAPPRTELHGLLYNKPCRAWIRRCSFISVSRETPATIVPGPGSRLTQISGIQRLDGAYEARQLRIVTPAESGPYRLEIEVLIESGIPIINDSALRLTERIHECSAKRSALTRQTASSSGRHP